MNLQYTVSNPGTIHVGLGPNQTACGNIKNRPTTQEYINNAQNYMFCEKCFGTQTAIDKAKEGA